MRRQARPRVGAIAAAALSFLAASTPVLAGDCCSCLTQTDPKASVLTYDATVYAQCHAAVGICCFNCGFGHGEPEYVSGIVDGVFPFQAVAGQWLEISINSVARVTYDFLLPNQPKVRFVNNQSTEATATGSNTFKICPKSAGTIIYRGWGAATCTQATDEYNITVVKGSGSATCGAPKPTSPGSGSSHTEQPNNKVDPMGVSSGSGVVKDNDPSDWQHCSSTRGSVQTHKDGSKYCECTGDWSNPPSCNKYSWTRTLLTVGGALATVLSIIFSIRAYYKSKKAEKLEQTRSEDSISDLDRHDSISNTETLHISNQSPTTKSSRSPATRTPIGRSPATTPVGPPVRVAKETTL